MWRRHFGDMTAYAQGRISLNPLRHIDPVGTILLPLLTLFVGGILFGWAKPVPVNFSALRHPKQDMLWVALAGPAANLVMALFWGAMFKVALMFPGNYFAEPLIGMAQFGVTINAILMVLNLLPLPPLDGGRIAISLLPHRQAIQAGKSGAVWHGYPDPAGGGADWWPADIELDTVAAGGRSDPTD